jgi:hypothetical protein
MDDKDFEKLKERVKALEARQQNQYEVMQEATMTARNPMGMLSRFERFETDIDKIIKSITKVNSDMFSLMTSSKYVELFTNEQIRNFYLNTNKTYKEIEMLLKTHFPESIFSATTVQNYINGNCPDVHIRSFLGKYLRNEANTKAEKAKQSVASSK